MNDYDRFKLVPVSCNDGLVDYGKIKVCAYHNCETILNHYRSKTHDYCCCHEALGMCEEGMDKALKESKRQRDHRKKKSGS